MNDQALAVLRSTTVAATATAPLATTPAATAPAPERKRSNTPAHPPARPPEPGPEQAPHEHPDDPGVHPDGPRRYHDDHGAPARMRSEEGVPA